MRFEKQKSIKRGTTRIDVRKIILLGRGWRTFLAILVSVLCCLPGVVSAEPLRNCAGTAQVRGGTFAPLYRDSADNRLLAVRDFLLDRCPVTNKAFLQFTKSNPNWQRSKAKPLFVGTRYLAHWKDDLDFAGPNVDAEQPVTNVSWFAAKAYCQWKGERLPSLAEWEYAALASEKNADGRSEAGYLDKILTWYSRPNPPKLAHVGEGSANFWGVHDLHGLVWEWTADFNSALVTGESRGDSALERNLFCGSGALYASEADKVNYAAFMRYGFRSSLQGNYTVQNLGFRCAKDLP